MTIKRPRKDRASYAVIDDQGKTVKDPRIDQINLELRQGVSRDVLEARLKSAFCRPTPRFPALQTNMSIVEDRHQHKLLRKPDLVDPVDLRRRLARAVEWIGDVSLREASDNEILGRLARILHRPTRFEATRGVNELLKHIGRSGLPNPRVPRSSEVAFIRVREFLLLTAPLKQEDRVVLGALFGTGCRWGELPLAEIGENSVYVRAQLRENGQAGLTKNRKNRRAPLVMPLISLIMAYNQFSSKMKGEIRGRRETLYKRFKSISGLRLHDLRHSYAVELRSIGVETSAIADYIGDTPEVCRRHYLNYCATDEEIDRVVALWK